MARADDLRSDYDRLGELLDHEDDGSKAAALARERRMIGELLDAMEAPEEVPVVDQLAQRRARSGDPRSTSRRRKSG